SCASPRNTAGPGSRASSNSTRAPSKPTSSGRSPPPSATSMRACATSSIPSSPGSRATSPPSRRRRVSDMVAETFPHALRLVLVAEGGLDDDPHDHGGRTAHGIIQREYDGFRARHGQPAQDVWKITPAEYTEIYHDRYWMPWCDRLPAGMDYAFFDACVNAGPAQAARTLQRALGLRADGNMGDVTLAEVKELSEQDPEGVIIAFCDKRRAFYRALAQFPRYGRGWLARVDHVEKAAKAMALARVEATRRGGLSDGLKGEASARAQAADTPRPPPPAPAR